MKMEKVKWDDDLLARRRARARVTAFILVGFIILFFLVSMVRLGSDILS